MMVPEIARPRRQKERERPGRAVICLAAGFPALMLTPMDEAMRKAILLFTFLCSVASGATASTLVVTADHHYVVRPSDRAILSTVFADEHLIANCKLDVFVVPALASSKRGYDELKTLDERSWTNALHWSLVKDDGTALPLRAPAVLRQGVRHHGPSAVRAADRDRLVDVTTYEGRFDLGMVPIGDSTLTVSVAGLTSSFRVAVRKGDESEVRDAFLEREASRAASYARFRDIQMERYRNDPTHLEPVFSVVDRALLEAPLEETQNLFALVIDKMDERRRTASDAPHAAFFSKRVRELRAAEKALPDYFANRADWVMLRSQGAYVIKERRSGMAIRSFAEEQVK